MKRYSNEFKVGIFFIVCIIGLFYMVYSTGKLNLKKEGYFVYVIFDDVAGLQKDAPVMFNGFEAGRVFSIEPYYDNLNSKIRLKLFIDKNIKIGTDAVVSIKTLGLMGEKYIQISSKELKDFIKPDSILIGKPYKDLDTLMDEAQNISNVVVGLINNVNSLTDEVKKIAVNVNYSVDENKNKISNIISNLELASKNIEELTNELKSNPWKLLYKPKK